MTRTLKKWTVRLTILSILVVGFLFIKKELNEFNSYPTGARLNEDSLKFNSEV